MALVFTIRADVADDVNATSKATAAFTPSANAGILVAVYTSKATTPDLPSLDSPSWLSGAWTQELDVVSSNSVSRLTIFSGKTVSSPGSAALTASYGGATQTGFLIQVFDVTGQDVTDFTLQPAITASSVNGTSASKTLAGALAATDSACVGFIGQQVQALHTPTGGETELADSGHALPARDLSTQYEINDTTSGCSWTGTAAYIIAVLEVKAAGGAFVPRNPAVNHQNPAFV